jgi:hypothetical protein
MPDIKDTVGNAASQVQDVAMIQMMLKVIKDAKGTPYLKVNYSGTWDDGTKDAIIRFQKDNGLIDPGPDPGIKLSGPGAKNDAAKSAAGAPDAGKAPAPAVKFDKAGEVAPKSPTLTKLNAVLDAKYKNALILPGTKTVYLPGEEADAAATAKRIGFDPELDMVFRQKAATFVEEFYKQTKIVLKAPPGSGSRRSFGKQMTVVAQAGPGESNHQFGRAADLGPQGLEWVDADGTIHKDTYWLNLGEDQKVGKKALMPPEKARDFWKAHNDLAFGKIGLFKTTLPGDDLHVQAYPDNSLSYSRSLATLLNKTGAMKWEGTHHVQGQQNKYKSDFGLGGKGFVVGTAKEVFGGHAQIQKSDLVAALNASKADLSKHPLFKDFKFVKDAIKGGKAPAAGKAVAITGEKTASKDITDTDLALLQKAAKGDWEKGEAHWKDWTPMP